MRTITSAGASRLSAGTFEVLAKRLIVALTVFKRSARSRGHRRTIGPRAVSNNSVLSTFAHAACHADFAVSPASRHANRFNYGVYQMGDV